MNEGPEPHRHAPIPWPWLILLLLIVVPALIAAFFVKENVRGKKGWLKCRQELEAKGAVLDWASYGPAPVPDASNIYEVPNMDAWFVRRANAALGGPNSGPLAHLPPLQYGSSNRVTIAEFKVATTSNASQEVWQLNSPATREKARKLVRELYGPTLRAVMGPYLITRELEARKAPEIYLEENGPVPTNTIRNLFPTNSLLKGKIRIRVENCGTNCFQAWMVPPQHVAAADYLVWSDRATNNLEVIRSALKRPFARIDDSYQQPYQMRVPNFIAIRSVAQTLAQRSQSYLLLKQPEAALYELTLLSDLSRLLTAEPEGKPIPLVSAMINVALSGLYCGVVADGLGLHAWPAQQLLSIQQQLKQKDLVSLVCRAFETERAMVCFTYQSSSPSQLNNFYFGTPFTKNVWANLKDPEFWLLSSTPKGWMYDLMTAFATHVQQDLESLNRTNQLLMPRKLDESARKAEVKFRRFSPYSYLTAIYTPNYGPLWQRLGANQALLAEALIACALERYRLAEKDYPEKLDGLVPRFLDKLPHDIIGGQPLKYRRTDQGKYLLYSIGWNEKDDGGTARATDFSQGDWVWENEKEW